MKARQHRERSSKVCGKTRRKKTRKQISSVHESTPQAPTPRSAAADSAEPSPSGSSATYVCSRCGFRGDDSEPDWWDPSIVVWKPKRKDLKSCWSYCPNDGGPDHGKLTAPDGFSQRTRVTLVFGSERVRVCTPYVLRSRTSAGRVTLGRALEAYQLFREVSLHRYLNAHGPDADIDLQRLYEANSIFDPIKVYRQGNLWVSTSFGPSIHLDEWAQKAKKLLRDYSPAGTYVDLERLASRLEPRFKASPHSLSHVLHMSFDLGQPIREQITRANNLLTGLREYLYRYTGKNPPRDRSDSIWRDLYIFLLVKRRKLNKAQISTRVFPDLPTKQGMRLVGQRLRIVENALSELDPII